MSRMIRLQAVKLNPFRYARMSWRSQFSEQKHRDIFAVDSDALNDRSQAQQWPSGACASLVASCMRRAALLADGDCFIQHLGLIQAVPT